jgi:DNA polymerase I-like protein with 3'-5' exonuclease and polymerase domains
MTTKFQYLSRPFIRPAPAGIEYPGTIFDIESDGFQKTATKIHCIVITELNNDRVEEFGPDRIEAGLERLSKARRLIGHNIIEFDLPLLLRLHGWSPAAGCVIADTLVASRLILPHIRELDAKAKRMGDPPLGKLTGSYSLEAWGVRLGFPKVGADIEDWSVWTPEIQARGINDALLNKRLWRFLQPDGQPPEALALEHRTAAVCYEITVAGMPFDAARAVRLQQQWEARRKKREEELRTQFPEIKSWNSRTQIGKLLVAQGWEPEELTPKTKQPSLTDEVLEELPKLFPKLAGLPEHWIIGRRLGQLANGEKSWLKSVGADGRIHGRIIHIGTPHSRASHSDPNIGQVPNPKRGKPLAAECRGLFRLLVNDWVFVACDQAGLQDRGFSHYLAEFDGGAYAEDSLAGLDPHWATAQALGLVPPEMPRDKENRLHGVLREGCKSWRYGFLFGMRGKRAGSIIYNTIKAAMRTTNSRCTLMREFFGTDIPSAAVIEAAGVKAINKFIDATPGLRELSQSLERQARNGWILGLDGRRVPVHSLHVALNFSVTSAEAILCKRWLVQVRDELGRRFAYGWDGDVVLVGWIHDELVACCRAEIADEIGEIMVRWAKETGEHYGFRCALDADYTIGRSWAGDTEPPIASEPPLIASEPPASKPAASELSGTLEPPIIPVWRGLEGAELEQLGLEDAELERLGLDDLSEAVEEEQPGLEDPSEAALEPQIITSESPPVAPEPPANPVQPGLEDASAAPAAEATQPTVAMGNGACAKPQIIPTQPDFEDAIASVEAAQPTAAMGNGAATDPWWCEPIAVEDMYWISLVEDVPPPVTCLDAALQWAGRGCSVFPAPPGAKKSYKSRERSNGERWGATRDPAEIERDWQRWPNANVGLPTDAANGFFVIEADTREGHPKLGDQDGLAALAALEREFGPLPNTLQAESPSGSQHRYFRHPAGAPVRSKVEWRHGIDIKGEGGMVLAPPSRRGDKAYRWVNQLPIAEAPQWFLDQLQDGHERAANGAWADGFSDEFLAEMAADVGQGVYEEETPAEKIRIALAVIPPTSREERINFGRALYRWFNGSEEGFALFAEWLSLRDDNGKQWWPEFVAVNARQVWKRFKEIKPPEQIVTIASIFGRANELDPTWWDRWDEAEYEALEARCAQAEEKQAHAARDETASTDEAGEKNGGYSGLGSEGTGSSTGSDTGNGGNRQGGGSDGEGGNGRNGQGGGGDGHGGGGQGGNDHGGNGGHGAGDGSTGKAGESTNAGAERATAIFDKIEPIDLFAQFAPPALPPDLLPRRIDEFAHEQGRLIGTDPVGLAVAALTCAAAAIPNHIELRVKRHGQWVEMAQLWTALVGTPSTKKSPIIRE